uniref:Uncharacterized protein n=1 Tax=Mesocestoides corti TaxID=53468 RepID=A0A5K3F947_MESCO
MLNHGASHLTTWRQDIILALPIKTAEAAREFAPATTTTTAAAAAATQRNAESRQAQLCATTEGARSVALRAGTEEPAEDKLAGGLVIKSTTSLHLTKPQNRRPS